MLGQMPQHQPEEHRASVAMEEDVGDFGKRDVREGGDGKRARKGEWKVKKQKQRNVSRQLKICD